MDVVPGVLPINVPFQIDPRAAGDRESGERLSALVREYSDDGWTVIADGAAQAGAINFQRMKGRNDLADKDLAIILGFLSPDEFAVLNVVGNWLGIPDIISMHYQDRLNQAVGRNSGYRYQGKRVRVLASNRLWNAELSRLTDGRTRLVSS